MSSVKARNRRKSYVQFVDTARQLLKHSFAYFKKFPKSATFMITIELADNARKIYSNVVMANSYKAVKNMNVIYNNIYKEEV